MRVLQPRPLCSYGTGYIHQHLITFCCQLIGHTRCWRQTNCDSFHFIDVRMCQLIWFLTKLMHINWIDLTHHLICGTHFRGCLLVSSADDALQSPHNRQWWAAQFLSWFTWFARRPLWVARVIESLENHYFSTQLTLVQQWPQSTHFVDDSH